MNLIEPLFSKFSDIFGRKYILMSGIVVFLIGSVLCGASQVNNNNNNNNNGSEGVSEKKKEA